MYQAMGTATKTDVDKYQEHEMGSVGHGPANRAQPSFVYIDRRLGYIERRLEYRDIKEELKRLQ